uniref:Uncharacterized protein n=1 Tax=Alexandrium monilatum TaxID=311494 RepID=A0A7S4W6Z4_9DINO
MAREHYRADGVRITHDPYAPGMVEKYGRPGETDNEGFDPYADTVGPGIYGGIVKRDPATGEVVVGRQYQNHNPRPGPVYAGGGYTPMSNALRKGEAGLRPLLDKYPDLVNDISTGGARPLHMCGMGRDNQHSTAYIISRGADIEALDTYGMTPLHRMASNNLAVGAEALLEARADPNNAGKCGATPLQIAQESQARDVMQVLKRYGGSTRPSPPRSEASAASAGRPVKGSLPGMTSVVVRGSGVADVNGEYEERNPVDVPKGFGTTCSQMGWDTQQMWLKLSNQRTPWFEAPNGSYIYWNQSDGQWWIDAPDGAGVYVALASATQPPAAGWKALNKSYGAVPTVEVLAADQSVGA